MKTAATTIDEYLNSLPEERREVMEKLRKTIKKNIPKGFKESLGYGMPGFVVPLETYKAGYHCASDTPLPFVNIASQKNFVALYHMGIYASKPLLDWFVAEYPKHSKAKLDMGKSCIRFKKFDQVPYELIGELMTKMSMEDWIGIYEKNYVRK